ncbi:MAG: cysteine peptidase family C39 domain-containing protein, partial [Candidatus Gorgyraea atricola]|nr:cysteine peptidase family C39 domain-containing protein [Candidatus Gorgyraea atricola]
MLDWQSKKWVKVIAITVVIAFLAYDVAWAMDFSPIAVTTSPSAGAPGIIPRIGNFISKSILKKDHKEELPEETEITFRSQLVPRKKYGERSGFQRLESVKNMIKRQEEFMRRQQQIEEDRRQRDVNLYNVNKGLYMDSSEKAQEAQRINQQVMKARGETFESAAASSEFSYTLNKDGSKIYYKDGLPSRILNESVYDTLGQRSIKNTYNMTYDGRRLMTSYDADIADSLGNTTQIQWRNGRYSDDSVWWAGSNTSAGKYLLGYTEIITDAYGTTMVRDWSTTRDSYDSQKRATSYTEIVKDATGSILSTTQWSSPTYEGDHLTGYHQETMDGYGNITLTDWDGKFERGHMLESHSIDKQMNRDGTSSVSENTLTYSYDSSGSLIGASGVTTISGGAVDVNGTAMNSYEGTTTQHFEILNGQLKIVYTTTEIEQVNADTSTSHTSTRFDYVYDENNMIVDASEISTTTGEDVFGSTYESQTISEYDVIGGQPRRVSSDTESVSETIFGTETTSTSHVEYIYDEMGNYTGEGARGYTDTTGINLFGEMFSTHTVNEYEIINGQPRLKSTQTEPNIPNPFEGLGTMLADLEETMLDISKAQASGREEEIAQIAEELKIERKSIVTLAKEQVQTVMIWLWKSSTNVINCAVRALKNILQVGGAEVQEEHIARDAILTDVLTGVITPENAKGELELSFYAMMKAAEKQDILLQGVHINIDQLKGISQPVIARLGQDHFVIIQSATDTHVTYLDNGVEKTEDITEFSYKWDGNVLTSQAIPGAQVLETQEAQAIRGAYNFEHNDAYTWMKMEFEDGGWELWKDTKTNPTEITYHTWNSDGRSEIDVDKNSGDITVHNWSTGKSEVIITAKRRFNAEPPVRGVDSATYEALSQERNIGKDADGNPTYTPDLSYIYATVQRTGAAGNQYIIKGARWAKNGAVSQVIDILRTIGGDFTTRNMYVYPNGFMFDPLAPPPDIPVETPESLTLTDAPYLEGVTATWTEDGVFGLWKELTFDITEKSEANGGLKGSPGANYSIAIDLDKDWVYQALDTPTPGVGESVQINLIPDCLPTVVGASAGNYFTSTGLSEADVTATITLTRQANYDILAHVTLTRTDNDNPAITQQIADFDFTIDNTPGSRSVMNNVSDIITQLQDEQTTANPLLDGAPTLIYYTEEIGLINRGGDLFEPRVIRNYTLGGEITSGTFKYQEITIGSTDAPTVFKGYFPEVIRISYNMDAGPDFRINQTIDWASLQSNPSIAGLPTSNLGNLFPTNTSSAPYYANFSPIGVMDSAFTNNPNNKDDPEFVYGQIRLEWDYYGDPGDDMVVERQTGSGSWQSLSGTIESDPAKNYHKTFLDKTAVRGSTYNYQIKASKDGNEKLSAQVSAHCFWEPPETPKNVKCSNSEPGELYITWDYSGNSQDRFEVYRSTRKSGTYNRIANNLTSRNYKDTDVNVGSSYYYKIVAVNLDGEDTEVNDSPIGTNSVKYQGTDAPTSDPDGITSDVQKLTIHWKHVANAHKYEVYFIHDPNDSINPTEDDSRWVLEHTETGTSNLSIGDTLTYEHNGLIPGDYYHYKIVSYDGNNDPGGSLIMGGGVPDVPSPTAAAPAPWGIGAPVATLEGVSVDTTQVVQGVEQGLLANISQFARNLNLTFQAAKDKITDIVNWLKNMGDLVVNCASMSLYRIFKAKGVRTTLEKIAIDTILVDLINGTIKPGSSSILYTSFYALQEIAFSKGLNLGLFKWTKNELSTITSPVIAHVSWDHAVVVTKVENGNVYYIDTDDKLYEVSIDDFIKDWTGYALAPGLPMVAGADMPMMVGSSALADSLLPTISVEMASRIVDRVVKELEFKQKFLGPGVNNFIENAGGLRKITDWLRRMGAYVVNCASKALYNVLAKFDIKTSLEDLAVETILSDLAAGIIKPGQTPILYTSFYSLHKVAFTKGVDLGLYNVTISELKRMEGPVIAEVGGDHAVVITKIQNDIVYLLESDGNLYKVDIDEFREDFQGFVLSRRGPPEKESLPLKPPIMLSGELLPPPSEPFLPPPPPAPEWDEGSKHWTSISSFSLDGSFVRADSWVSYEYNNVGQVIGAKGGGISWAEDIFGNLSITRRTDIYEVIAGEAKVIYSISLTTSKNLDGSINTSIGMIHYIYDNTGVVIGADCNGTIGFDKFSLDEGQLDENDLDLIMTWISDGDFIDYLTSVDTDGDGTDDAINISAANLTLGEDVFGNPLASATVNTYEIIGGEAKVMLSSTVSDSTAFDGTIIHANGTVSYDYTYGTETIDEIPDEYLNEDGTIKEKYLDEDTEWIKIGLFKHVEGESTTEGQDIFGSTYTATAINHYTLVNGQPRVDYANTTRTDETFMGITSNSSSYMKYEYGLYADPDTGREAETALVGATGYNDATGRDIFGNTYKTHTDNTYTVDKGQPLVDTANSSYLGGSFDLFGNPSETNSIVTYSYSEVTGKDGRTAYLATETATVTSSSGEDLFGNARYSVQSQEVTANYGLCDFIDPRTNEEVSYWGIVSAVETSPMITEGIDTFGNKFTTTSTTTFEAGDNHYGKQVGVETISETEGIDLYGSSYASRTVTNNAYALQSDGQGKFAYLADTAEVTSTSDREDIFGNSVTIVTPQISKNEYGITTAPDGLDIWGVINATELQSLVTESVDMFGSSVTSETINEEYVCEYGVPVATRVITKSNSIDLFGAEVYQEVETINIAELHEDTPSRLGYLISSFKTTTIATGEDLFGNQTITTTIQEIQNGAFVADDEAIHSVGQKFWGGIDIISYTQTQTGSDGLPAVDMFGSEITNYTSTLEEYHFKNGRLFVDKTVVTYDTQDLFGGIVHNSVTSETTYGWYEEIPHDIDELMILNDLDPDEIAAKYGWSDETAYMDKVEDLLLELYEGLGDNETLLINLPGKAAQLVTKEELRLMLKSHFAYLNISVKTTTIATGEDLFGNQTITTTIQEIQNGAFVADDEAIHSVGKKFWGGIDIISYTQTQTGPDGLTAVDMFGSEITNYTSTLEEYHFKNGRLFVDKTVVTYDTQDLFGGIVHTNVVSETTYGWYTNPDNDKKAYLNISVKTTTIATGEDLFGNQTITTTIQEIQNGAFVADLDAVHSADKTFWGGIDIISYTQTQTGPDGLAAVDMFGSKISNHSATINASHFKNGRFFIDKMTVTYDSMDLFGAIVHNTVITEYTYGWHEKNGKKAYLIQTVKTTSTADVTDLFGNQTSTTTIQHIQNGEFTATDAAHSNGKTF